MYGYYAATELGLSRKWGLLITPLQLGQFIVCLVWVSTEWLSAAIWGTCDINLYTLSYVYACYVIFLYLFYAMYTDKKKLFNERDTVQGTKAKTQ